MKKITTNRIVRKKRRVRGNVVGTSDLPKISVFRSNRYLFAQAIDDIKRQTIASSTSFKKGNKGGDKTNHSKEAGKELAQKLLKKGIKRAVFDRGQYVYLGRIKAFAEGLREGGIQI